jgi:hypothetical protein
VKRFVDGPSRWSGRVLLAGERPATGATAKGRVSAHAGDAPCRKPANLQNRRQREPATTDMRRDTATA